MLELSFERDGGYDSIFAITCARKNDNFFTITKMHIIAERLKELREARHLSQRAFALQLGVPQPSYSRYETSDDERFVYPGSNIVIRICKLFDCRAGWLLGLEGPESAPTLSASAPPRETKIRTGDIKGNGNVVGSTITVNAPPQSTSSSQSTSKKRKAKK